MAMEKQYMIRDAHTRSLTAIGYNPSRREIVVGCEDGVIKSFEAEGGKLVATFTEHKGWVTDFLYWSDTKLLLSSANDSDIIAWGSGGGLYDRVFIGVPVYCMAINPRRHQLVCGVNGGIRVYALDEERECGHVINNHVLYFAREHTDIVRAIVCMDSRIYSGGYDQKLLIYDSSYTGDNSLDPIFNYEVHDAGITCLKVAKDNENNTWILTGSFDKSFKIWSMDGKLVHKIDNFLGSVTGCCYVPRNKTVWVAGGASYAWLYDPKSGENVSDFIGTFQSQEEEKYHLLMLNYFSELSQVVATTSRRALIVWKFNPSACITALKCNSPLESLAYTRKVPILIFSGDHEGIITKWERTQSNHFMYSKEPLSVSVEMLKKSEETARLSTHEHTHTTILRILFVENLDCILVGSEDSNIYVWGFDENAVEVLKNMRPADVDILVQKYAILLDTQSLLLPQNSQKNQTEDSVTNRVAGFVCKYVMSEHFSCVTSLVLVGREHGQDSTYVLSGGWDRRICLWDIEEGSLKDVYSSSQGSAATMELACDGIIHDMAYSPDNNEFAYASSDKMVYIRKFRTVGREMTLVNTLQGHDGEVTAIKWSPVCRKWITGSEDGTVRIWSGSHMNDCEQVLSMKGGVTCLCIDRTIGSIIVGVQNNIRVYDPENYHLVQSNLGHTDSVRDIIHIPERNQYVSSSWDKTIRVWNAWKMPRRRHQPKKTSGSHSRLGADHGSRRSSQAASRRVSEAEGGSQQQSQAASRRVSEVADMSQQPSRGSEKSTEVSSSVEVTVSVH